MQVRTGLVLGLLLAVTVAGCSTPNDPNKVATASGQRTATSSTNPGEQDPVKFAQCMRDNGVPNFPDPTVANDGHMSMGLAPDGADPAKVDAATQKCNHYLPNGGAPQKLDPQQVEQMRNLAKCIRDNGVPDFPDPDANGNMGIPLIDGASPEIQNTPRFQKLQAAQKACAKYSPRGTPNSSGAGQ